MQFGDNDASFRYADQPLAPFLQPLHDFQSRLNVLFFSNVIDDFVKVAIGSITANLF